MGACISTHIQLLLLLNRKMIVEEGLLPIDILSQWCAVAPMALSAKVRLSLSLNPNKKN
jgi:hypothetical protein